MPEGLTPEVKPVPTISRCCMGAMPQYNVALRLVWDQELVTDRVPNHPAAQTPHTRPVRWAWCCMPLPCRDLCCFGSWWGAHPVCPMILVSCYCSQTSMMNTNEWGSPCSTKDCIPWGTDVEMAGQSTV